MFRWMKLRRARREQAERQASRTKRKIAMICVRDWEEAWRRYHMLPAGEFKRQMLRRICFCKPGECGTIIKAMDQGIFELDVANHLRARNG